MPIGISEAPARAIRLGLRVNWQQFALLVLVNAFVGGMVGLERSVLPLLAQRDFGIVSRTAILSFLLSFGLVKAGSNYAAGHLADRFGRKHVLLLGWAAGIPVPFMIIWAPSWGWVIAANVFLGVNQGLAWSTTVNMKIDLVGPRRRGLALGLNEAAGYVAVALAALAAGYLAGRYGIRPAPFLLGIAFSGLGFLITLFFVRETAGHMRLEASELENHAAPGSLSSKEIFLRTTLRDRNLSSASQAGLVNNLNDGMAWGLLPLFFVAAHLSLLQIGVLAATYPAVWGTGQLLSGWASDYLGRKILIVTGMWIQAGSILLIAVSHSFVPWLLGAIGLGAGTALVYPTLLAAIGDAAHPSWRASAVGVYRLWRDLGYAASALFAGLIADALGFSAAIASVAGLTALSGTLVLLRMREPRSQLSS